MDDQDLLEENIGYEMTYLGILQLRDLGVQQDRQAPDGRATVCLCPCNSLFERA